MIELMEELRDSGLRMAMLTNNVREWEPLWRSMLPVDEIFELVVDSAFVGCRKPDREIYEIVLERLDCPPRPASSSTTSRSTSRRRGRSGTTAVHFRDNEQAIGEIRPLLRLAPPPDRRSMSAIARRIRGIGPWGLALGGILLAGLLLRLWGIKYGLPFGYQIDEERTYTRIAGSRCSTDGSIDPGYFQNPPLYAYLLEVVFCDHPRRRRTRRATIGSSPRPRRPLPDRADRHARCSGRSGSG